jgi:hypothetical protein
MLNRNYGLETVKPAIIYLLLKYMYEASRFDEYIKNKKLKEEELNPENYFTDIEIEKYKDFIREKSQEDNFPLVFNNVLKLADDQYFVVMSIQKIADMYANNLIRYNKQTQRNTVYKNGLNDNIYVNTNSVKEIRREIENGTYIPTVITLNILQDGEEDFYYDEETKQFVIEKGFIDVADGYHRSRSIIEVVKDNQNIQLNMGVFFTNFTVEKGRKFIRQEDKKNKINKKYIESLNTEKLSNLVVKKLNESPESELINKITTNGELIRVNRMLTFFTTMSDAIDYNFELKTKKDVSDVSNFLIQAFNTLMGTYPDEFINKIKETKDYNVMNHQNIFIGYVALFSKLYKNPKWEDILYNVMNKVDFINNNPVWKELNLFTKIINKPIIKKISDYFKSLA